MARPARWARRVREKHGRSRSARELGAVVLDLDVIKSALLNSGVDWETSGRASYRLIDAMAEQSLSNGLSVVVDVPSYWAEIHERLQATAGQYRASYQFLECTCSEELRLSRVRQRVSRRSQIRDADHGPVDAPPTDAPSDLASSRIIARPSVAVTTVDTSHPVDVIALIDGWHRTCRERGRKIDLSAEPG